MLEGSPIERSSTQQPWRDFLVGNPTTRRLPIALLLGRRRALPTRWAASLGDVVDLSPTSVGPRYPNDYGSVTRKVSGCPLSSLGTRFEAQEENVASEPSSENCGPKLCELPGSPLALTLSRMTESVHASHT